MAVNKVIYGGTALIDLTEDSVAADTLAEGVTAHDAAGVAITGTGSLGAVRYDAAQSLTDAEKSQARENIGAPGKVFEAGASAPVDTGILWIDTGNGNVLKFYNSQSGSWENAGAVWG